VNYTDRVFSGLIALFGDILERFAYPDIRKINIPI
jgi:hypothetical protein